MHTTSPPPLNLQPESGWSNPGSAGAGPSAVSPVGKGFYGSSKLCDGSVRVQEAVWHQSHPSLTCRSGQSSSGTTQLTHTGGGALPFRHTQHSWVPSPMKKGGRPDGSAAWTSSSLDHPWLHKDFTPLSPLTHWGEGSNIIPILPQDHEAEHEVHSHKVTPSSQIVNIMTIQHSLFKCVIKPFFCGLVLIFYYSTHLKVWGCWVLVSFQDYSPLSSLLCCWGGWALASSHRALRNILH